MVCPGDPIRGADTGSGLAPKQKNKPTVCLMLINNNHALAIPRFSRRLAQGQTPERVSSRHHVRFPVEIATQQTFSILRPIMKGPPGGQDVICKDPNTTVLGIRAAAFLFLSGSAVFVLRAKGKEGYSIHLRVPGGDEEPLTLAMGAS